MMDGLREFWEFMGYLDTAGGVVAVVVAVVVWWWRRGY